MYSSTTATCIAIVIFCIGAWGKEVPKQPDTPVVGNHGLDLTNLPINQAVYAGVNVTFTCWADNTTETPRIQWMEYASNENGNLITDGDFVLPSHPYPERFILIRNDPYQYDLVLLDAVLSDGGVYSCADANAPISQKQRHAAQLIVFAGMQNCTTTIPDDAIIIEDAYHTIECTSEYDGNISPTMRWSGPQPFGQGQTDSGTKAWSGMSFNAARHMATQNWHNQMNFTDYFLPVPVDTADNIPDLVETYLSIRVNVQWGPKNMYAEPISPTGDYQVNDTMTCYADAYPTAAIEWHNMRTNERFESTTFTIPESWQGFTQSMRCNAQNMIRDQIFTADYYVEVNVPTPTTTPPTTTAPTTTTAPPVSDCYDLTGRWESVNPLPALMCIEVLNDNGYIHGVLRNGTETFWVDLIGLAEMENNDHASWTGIWPDNRAVSAMIAECSRCFGEEHLIVNAISRSKGGPPCATPGEIHYTQEFHFFRNPVLSCPPITIPE